MPQKAMGADTRYGLSGNALKIIAIIAMTIDHVTWMGIETYSQAHIPGQIILHMIGRSRGYGMNMEVR